MQAVGGCLCELKPKAHALALQMETLSQMALKTTQGRTETPFGLLPTHDMLMDHLNSSTSRRSRNLCKGVLPSPRATLRSKL